MKKLILIVMALAIASTASAQDQAKGTFGVRAGLNVASVSMKLVGLKQSYDSKIGFHVGLAYQQPLGRTLPLFLETGLYASTKGGTLKFEGEKESLNLFYLQLPVMVGYRFNITDNIALKPTAGLYLGYGLGGKAKYPPREDYEGSGYTESYDVFKKDEDGHQGLKRLDMGLRLGVGADLLKRYFVGMGYEIGMANISGDDDVISEVTTRINCFTVTVGYNF